MLDEKSPSDADAAVAHLHRQTVAQQVQIGPSRLSVCDNPSRTNSAVESFHAGLRRRIKVPHPNLFAFLGHLQHITIDSVSYVSRVTRGLAIRRAYRNALT